MAIISFSPTEIFDAINKQFKQDGDHVLIRHFYSPHTDCNIEATDGWKNVTIYQDFSYFDSVGDAIRKCKKQIKEEWKRGNFKKDA